MTQAITTTNASEEADLLTGWFNLAKPARAHQQKRGWQKGGCK